MCLGIENQNAQPEARQAQALYKQGMAALERGDLDGGKKVFQKPVRAFPESADAHNSLGWVLLNQA
jgi:TolA-binding protein